MNWDEIVAALKDPIHILGYVGQLIFFSRFLLQWVASERQKESVIPIGFWYCSVVGGLLTLVYGIMIKSPPVVMGQMFGNVVYIRNLTLIYRKRAAEAAASTPEGSEA